MDSGSSADVPPFFICSISLEIMKDPVTISTGMTFDRESIHKWLFQYNQNTCPVTKQALPDQFVIPNSNLLRLIRSWIVSYTTKRFRVRRWNPGMIRVFLVNFDIASILASIVMKDDDEQIEAASSTDDESWEIIEEAVLILDCINLPGEKLKKLAQEGEGKFIALLSSVVVQQESSYQERIQADSLLKSIFRIVDDVYKVELKIEMFEGIAEILKDQNSTRGSIAALLILIEVLPYGNSRKKAVEVGIVTILIELLSETSERRICEVLLHVQNQICKGADGRAAFLDHPVAVAAVSSKILRISHVANDRGVTLLSCLFRYCETSRVAKEMLEVGGVAKMCMVVQTPCSSKTKDKAKAILGMVPIIVGALLFLELAIHLARL
ncbi:hypothetical protein ACH5RR_000049 [Cinchona calisaya]|uniref:U-box domain-containing protein n=1 Tax=Cinchona calisaya TaxID=153742 RepID=A0ABD3AZY8_9GENT